MNVLLYTNIDKIMENERGAIFHFFAHTNERDPKRPKRKRCHFSFFAHTNERDPKRPKRKRCHFSFFAHTNERDPKRPQKSGLTRVISVTISFFTLATNTREQNTQRRKIKKKTKTKKKRQQQQQRASALYYSHRFVVTFLNKSSSLSRL